MQKPLFTLQDVKYSVDEVTFQKAKKLFESGKVMKIKEDFHGYHTIVQGTSPYNVSISRQHVDKGFCDCYMGQNDMLCKLMLALGLAVLSESGLLELHPEEGSPTDLRSAKVLVSTAMRKIKPYNGPSKIWFSYQRELDVGSGCIIEAVQKLPASEENAKYIWYLVLKLSKKLSHGGIDDSNGTSGTVLSF